jgi:hypothetical protein
VLPRRVAAGAGFGDGLVEFLDGLEHRRDVGDPEPVDADIADVRLVVQPDVAAFWNPTRVIRLPQIVI